MVLQGKQYKKHERQLTPYDLSVLTVVNQQRAISLDHLPRFIALFETQSGKEHKANLKSTTHNLVEHLQHTGHIHLQRFGESQPDWIWLTKKGVQELSLSSPWKRPTRTMLPALHAANTIRLLLTENDPQISWTSQQQLRSAEAIRERHQIPTAELETERGEHIALHVVLRLTGTEEQIIARLLKQLERETALEKSSYNALWYYATADSAKKLRAARVRIAELTTKEIARKIWIFSYPLTHRQVLYRGHCAAIRALAWSPDGKWLASASEDEMLHIWDAVTGKERFHHALSACPSVIGWSCRASWIALGDEDGRLSCWQGVTGKLHMATLDYAERITGLAWSPLNDDSVVSCSAQGRLRMYDLRQNTLQWEVHRSVGIEALAWSPDGTRLALGGNDACVHLMNATTGKHLQMYKKHGSAVRALAWSSDSQWLASASHDASILIWDATSGKKRRTVWSGLDAIDVLSWSSDGTKLACAGSEPYVHVWDVNTGRLLQTYADHSGEITGIAWSPDNSLLASASCDGTVHVYPVVGGH